MKIGVITDIHANLPALVAALNAIDAEGCDEIIHTGDAIGIGPHPREVMELLLSRPDITCIMGNHDELFIKPELVDPYGDRHPGEGAHVRWQHAQLDDSFRSVVRSWPWVVERTMGSTTIRFQHYAMSDGAFCPVSETNLPVELDAAFQPETDFVCFGHHHRKADVQGTARYINPGALGCHPGEGARYAVIESDGVHSPEVRLNSAPYNAETVIRDLIDRNVPEAQLIIDMFMGPTR